MSLSADLRAVLARDPDAEWRPRDLRDALGLSSRQDSKRVMAHLSQMLAAGLAIRTGKGRYRLGRPPQRPDMRQQAGQGRVPHVSRHAAEAARCVLDGLTRRGLHAESVDEAIRRGLLTDLEWCATLDEFRERYGVGSPPAPARDLFPDLPRKRAV